MSINRESQTWPSDVVHEITEPMPDFRVSAEDNELTRIAPIGAAAANLLHQCGYGLGWDAVTVGHRESLDLLQIITENGLTWDTQRPTLDMRPRYTEGWANENR